MMQGGGGQSPKTKRELKALSDEDLLPNCSCQSLVAAGSRQQPLNEWKVPLNGAEIDDALDAASAAHSASHSDCESLPSQAYLPSSVLFYIVSHSAG